ncbi:serine/threonine-protein kinase [Klenkia brasiliensis]|uniref:non-specific serine/threonine protein kinase n=1 Tax=Klenkia brasiliensis TaxID=333142 RepID=A0A1G7MM94_9ACTN|nr:serine/threonine-protein kinase [Klenkia brasiliensis]SDF62746.1 Serine/threonine protein kinase [Klenkia brasiliensis]
MTPPGQVGPGYRVAGRYLLAERIGGGGMGAVWVGTDERLGRRVAVKQLVLPVGITDESAREQRERMMREGRIAARISHPHAIAVYDVAEDAGVPWLVMEHLPSRSLAAVLSDDGVLPVLQVAQIGAQLADALVAVHAAGIVHRDVKPGNVLVGRGEKLEGLVKITDFGISHAQGDVKLTQTGMVTGTPAFLSPEVARGETAGPAGDVWSLGATLFTALEGQPPFGSSGNSLELLYRVAGTQPDRPVRSGALTPVLERMLTTDPAGRPSMTEVRDSLARVAAGDDGDVTAVLTARTPLRVVPPPPVDPTRVELPAQQAPQQAQQQAPPPHRTVVTPRAAARRSWLPAGAVGGVVIAALAAGALWLNLREDSDSSAAAPTSTAATSTQAAAPPPSAEAPTTTAGTTTEETTTAQTTTEASPTTGADALTAADVEQAVTGYYALLPQDPQSAWQLTGPTLQGVISRGGYISFWNGFSAVRLGAVTAQEGSLTASAQVTFVDRDGTEQVEQHQFTLVQGPDGRLLMDRDVAV